MNSQEQETMRVTRRSLKTLQHTAVDGENLVGRGSKTLKHQHSPSPTDDEMKRKSLKGMKKDNLDSPKDVEVKKINLKGIKRSSHDLPVDAEAKKNTLTKEVQVNLDKVITVEDLTNPLGASENYWKLLAEKRQLALQEALDENDKLRKCIADLKQENVQFKQMLEEANSFVEVIKEELANAGTDDTGIDVNDVSTADETTEYESLQSSPTAE